MRSDMGNKCQCQCGCNELATEVDDNGVAVCAACGDYYVTADGDVVCSREQGRESCRRCGGEISWGGVQTGQPGVSNFRYGECACGEVWVEKQRGRDGDWDLSEMSDPSDPGTR